jgi:hypothetical protein
MSKGEREREREREERRWEGGIATAERVERQTRKRGRETEA